MQRFAILTLVVVAVLLILVTPVLTQTTTVKPAIVRDLDNGDRQEIYSQDVTAIMFEPAQSHEECFDPVPAGKRLVVEHLTARVNGPIGQSVYVGVKVGGLRFSSFLPLVYQGVQNGRDYYVSSVPAKVRAAAGQRVCVLSSREPGTGQTNALVTVSGYLIDAP